MNKKPIGRKNYGSIPHLPSSRMGPADRKISEGQARIATLKLRDKHDTVIVQEKLDGSNVGVAMQDGKIFALTRSGYEAHTSPYQQHHEFSEFVKANEERFRSVLTDGCRLCGEWLTDAHGTIYDLPHEPFVAFDLICGKNKRTTYLAMKETIGGSFVMPYEISVGPAVSVADALEALGKFGKHGATEQIEGAVWRVERKGIVDYLCKYVRPDKVDGKYMNGERILNTWRKL
jgi:hypothetical protein